jgi:hypothetical protein
MIDVPLMGLRPLLGLLTLEAVALAVAEVIHQVVFLIFLCLTLTGKRINDDDDRW